MTNIIDFSKYKIKLKNKEDIQDEMRDNILKREIKIEFNYFEVFCILIELLDSLIIAIDEYSANNEELDEEEVNQKDIAKYDIETGFRLFKKFLKYEDKFEKKEFKLNGYIAEELIEVIEKNCRLNLIASNDNLYDIEFLEGLQEGSIDRYVQGIYYILRNHRKDFVDKLKEKGLVEEIFDNVDLNSCTDEFLKDILVERTKHEEKESVLLSLYSRTNNRYLYNAFDFDDSLDELTDRIYEVLEVIKDNEEELKDCKAIEKLTRLLNNTLDLI